MRARIENGKIVKYPKLPNTFQGSDKHYLMFDKEPGSVHDKCGFYEIITPSYDSESQYISNLHTIDNYKDADGKTKTVFIYDVKDKTFGDSLTKMKADKIKELNGAAYNKLQLTDWYVIRKAEKGTAIPDAIEEERDNIRSSVDTKESEINAHTKKVDAFNYDISL